MTMKAEAASNALLLLCNIIALFALNYLFQVVLYLDSPPDGELEGLPLDSGS